MEGYPWEVKAGLRLVRIPWVLEECHYISGVWAEPGDMILYVGYLSPPGWAKLLHYFGVLSRRLF